jgi:hypothetical protein
MQSRELESAFQPRPHLSWQVANRPVEKSYLAPQRDPLAQMVTGPGNGLLTEAYASVLNHATVSRPSRAGRSLLQLQRRYGNRYVQQVIALPEVRGSEVRVVSGVEGPISQAIQRLPLVPDERRCQAIERDLTQADRELQQTELDICQNQEWLREEQECARRREQGRPETTRCLILTDVATRRQRLNELGERQRQLQQRMQTLREQLRRECNRDFPIRPPVQCR